MASRLYLVFFRESGRFPRDESEVEREAVAVLTRQINALVPVDGEAFLTGRTAGRMRAEIRARFGFREATMEDAFPARLIDIMTAPDTDKQRLQIFQAVLPYAIDMCGRFRLSRRGKEIAEEFATEEEVDWFPRFNIAPSDQIPTVVQDAYKPVRNLTLMRWGLIPTWAKDPSIGSKTINGMSETAASKPAFREAIRTQRCLVPADGFYEWKKIGSKEKQSYNFGMADDSNFAFAGLWDRWKDAAGKQILSCTILTTGPNALVADVHARMPAILRRDDYDRWLDPGVTEPARIAELLIPFEAQLMKRYPVSTRVNSVKNDDPQCAQEIVLPEAEDQRALFVG